MKGPILITGASGFVGANLARRLVQMGKEVHVILRKEFKGWRIKDVLPKMVIHITNLEDAEAVKKVIKQIKPKTIFHLAAYGAYPFQKDVNQMLHTNILGTTHLVNACIEEGFSVFINTGTSSEYGYKKHPAVETDWLEPNSYYAVSKASATMYCSYTSKLVKLPIITFRLFSVFGSYEEPTRFIPTLIVHGLKGELPPLVSPETARDFIYIDDVIDAYIGAAEQKVGLGEVYNIGTGKQTSIGEVVNLAVTEFGLRVAPQWSSMTGRIWDTSIWVSDVYKATTQLQWKPKRTFEIGFKETVLWMKNHLDLYC